MSVTINGTTGIAGVDGSASTPAYQGADTNTGIAFPAADTVSVATGGTERMRIASAGGVHIGTTSTYGTNSKLSVFGSATAADTGIVLSDGATTTIGLALATQSTGSVPYIFGNNNLAFGSNGAERMRIDSSGNVGIGTVSPATKFHVSDTGTGTVKTRTQASTGYVDVGMGGNSGVFDTTASDGIRFRLSGNDKVAIDSSGNLMVGTTSAGAKFHLRYDGNATVGQVCDDTYASAGTNKAIQFKRNNSEVGTIGVTTTSTAYNTSSDYRLKDNVAPMTGALATVAALKPCTYTWKIDGSAGQGFIAHELQAVVPDCVTGEKDAVETYTDEEGNEQTRPIYQGVDTSFLVATLTAAIQELKAIADTQAQTIESLTARIEALEASNV